ncbi:1-acyl-sn-glycerol-3-phosphate acyltransferase [Brumimicrobium aurantiacum]|uniref:Phospholipid/glycerol acyltransferase domain-containing protein n=1 Tax=Brumimicrobium aurantiacum TaxID=1737063 RepID=A0A3E1EY48_9FLAO|nr:1-acyl-sn-glycerol-3-phosphate acyltransferase [Brumimicrobium aurantiacum]RFC54481.1 hypothetical protein DXU93_08660 [Brumimicrobium aurantiacum]
MRILYIITKFILKLTLWVYYPRKKIVNAPQKRFTRTIFMCNHPSSFMDPLAVVGSQKPITFFMTRSDVFKPFLKPILWAAHMLPIYRQQDGVDTKKKNEKVFDKCATILKNGRGLIVFSEGFTDNVFIRRLKPIKKGAVRIGFTALEKIDWKKKIYLQAVGSSFADPNQLGSDLVISNGDPICLNDYRKDYEKDPNKIIHELTLKMELQMRDQIVDVRNEKVAPFHENVMRITRKGMNANDSDFNIPLLKRWNYAKRLADWFNKVDVENNEELMKLKAKLEAYFNLQKEEGVEETPLYKVLSDQRKKNQDLFYLIALFPVMLLGLIHCYLPYRFIKNFVEKSFKRRVFWGSVKMLLGFVAICIYNLPIIFLMKSLLGMDGALAMLYYLTVIPLSGVIAYNWFKVKSKHQKMNVLEKSDVSKIAEMRNEIENEIDRLIPVA